MPVVNIKLQYENIKVYSLTRPIGGAKVLAS